VVAVIVIVVVVVVVMAVHKGLDLHVRGVLLERSLHSTGLLGWNPGIQRKGLAWTRELVGAVLISSSLERYSWMARMLRPLFRAQRCASSEAENIDALNLSSLVEEI
jgi:hypothetical protein